ncbi:diguanylate cyclase domain-containing protein [Trichothermofontia sp.]
MDSQGLLEQDNHLLQELMRLRQEIRQLQAEIQDLHIALSTTAEHGDLIEAQLYETNQQLQAEISVRQKAEAMLYTLLDVISREKSDLEIIVQTIMEHGDVVDTQWSRKLAEISLLAASDGLTQIPNRRHFDQHLAQQWRQMAREQKPLAILLCDIDYFKQYNDAYGHLGGDDCLKLVAQALSHHARRPYDLVARYGGEEFAVILPGTDWEGAIEVAQRLKTAIAKLQIPHSASRVAAYVTVSIGVASMIPSPNLLPTHLITIADRNLYLAKHQGRDRIVPAQVD